MRKITLYRTCSGVNNKIDAARLPFDAKKGITALEIGADVLVDQSGGLVARRGTALAASGDYLSAHPLPDGSFLAAKNRATDSAIYKVTPGASGALSEQGIVSGLAHGAKVCFCDIGDETFYMNGFQSGVISNGLAYDWPVNEWPRDTVVQFVAAPVGKHFDIHSGRIVILVDDEIVYTELWLFGLIDKARNWRRLESRGLMIRSVGTGVYISDSSAVYFLAGTDPKEWRPVKVLNYPAVEFAVVPGLVDPSHFGLQVSNPALLFGTVEGPALGLHDGTVVNLINKQVALPRGIGEGSLMVVDETTVLFNGV